ncbi:hypothetical protein WGP40_03770 [Brachymonas sp. G13]|uniref:hypothetical protein n=1 Tax=Brachymonas TaxID=28219 RepID=UPI001699781E|nr:hypothetical protein [Brachymonas sp. J145]MEE1652733.1 hypothetical protein [Brachymonas sp. J145]NLX17135.1 hypothetical protein [Ramlibacter sp.]
MQAIIAYLVGLFIITPLIINITGLVFAKIAAEEASRTLLVIGAGIGAVASYLILKPWFGIMDTSFPWYAYLICMTPVILNDLHRIGRGSNPDYLMALLVGMGVALAVF